MLASFCRLVTTSAVSGAQAPKLKAEEEPTCLSDEASSFQPQPNEDTSLEDSEEVNTEGNVSEANNQLEKRKKKRNYCKYCKVLVSNFSRHVQRKHGDTAEGKRLLGVKGSTGKERENKKKLITRSINKLWNDEYNNIILSERAKKTSVPTVKPLIPVKSCHSKSSSEPEFVKCSHCMGLYLRRKFFLHLRKCTVYTAKQEHMQQEKKLMALVDHSEAVAPQVEGLTKNFLIKVLSGLKNNEIGKITRNDPLIILFGVIFLKSRTHVSEINYVRRQMRTLGMLLLNMKKVNSTITDLESCLTPKHFSTMVQAVENWCEINEDTGKMKVASVPYRVLTPVNECIAILHQKRLEDQYKNGLDGKLVKEIEDFELLLKKRWASLLGRIATKNMKNSKTLTTGKLAVEGDLYKVCSYITSNYEKMLQKLKKKGNSLLYNQVMDMLLAHIICLCRRRPVDLTRATLNHYRNIDNTDDLVQQAHLKPGDLLTSEDLANCKFFKTFYVPGKNFEKVPVVLTPKMKTVLEELIKLRKDVGISKDTLFIHSDNKPINAGRSLEKVKEKVLPSLQKPNELTALGLRHHAATFSKLHSTNPHYQDFLASAMGHTLFMHKTKYDLPISVLHFRF